jgi:hypothetical protein
MDGLRFRVLLCVSAALTATLAGCVFPAAPARTSNQGGGNLLTLGLKATQGQLTTTTADEWQILFDTVSEANANLDIELSDDQAEAVVDFLGENNLDSFQDIEDLVTRVEQDPSLIDEIVIPDSLMTLITSEIDLDSVIDVAG